jgi:hypothetical protein
LLTDDELARVAETVVTRVDPEGAADPHEPECRVDHVAIARVGIEEGLKLAARLLRERSGRRTTSASDLAAIASCESEK